MNVYLRFETLQQLRFEGLLLAALLMPTNAVGQQSAPSGYAPQDACVPCHQEIAESYGQVRMSRSFTAATEDQAFEDFSKATGYHEKSKRYYQMKLENGRYIFRRYQLDDEKNPINSYEQEVDWLLGSGRSSRSYLYQTESGEIFQLPIVYYPQERIWYMSPGYDRPDHQGVTREVRRECMFCHNAYPEAAQGSDAYGAPHVYPTNLPQGIDCQRCHGPGAEHARLAAESPADAEPIRNTIVNPARLEAKERDAVCDQCHLQPSVTLLGVRRFGRSDYSFRPGEALSDYLPIMDVVEDRDATVDRFEINHHSYRLRQSACYLESGADLRCTTCHDPHKKVAVEDEVTHYRAACLGCHEEAGVEQLHTALRPPVRSQDCASCHMPQRRTQDVVHAVATDHLIRPYPGGPDLTAPRAEQQHNVTEVRFLDPSQAPEGVSAEMYKAAAVSRFSDGAYLPAVTKLNELIDAEEPPEIEPYLDLARGQLRRQDVAELAPTLEAILERDPDNLRALQWSGLVDIIERRFELGIEHLLQALRVEPDNPETHYNLGLALFGSDEDERARKHFAEAVRLRPNMYLAWYYLGRAHMNLDRSEEAVQNFKQVLAIEPSHTRGYLELGKALVAQDNPKEAVRYYRHGLKVARQLGPIAKALDDLGAGGP